MFIIQENEYLEKIKKFEKIVLTLENENNSLECKNEELKTRYQQLLENYNESIQRKISLMYNIKIN